MSKFSELRELLESIDKNDLWNTAKEKVEKCLALLEADEAPTTPPLNEEERQIFDAIHWPTNMCLIRSAMFGKPAAVVAAVDNDETTGEVIVMPVFVIVSEGIMQELEKPS